MVMKASFSMFLTQLSLAAILLAVVAPVLCELDTCCNEPDSCCTEACVAICSVVAVRVESYDGREFLAETLHQPAPYVSSLPQGELPLPERPPIASC